MWYGHRLFCMYDVIPSVVQSCHCVLTSHLLTLSRQYPLTPLHILKCHHHSSPFDRNHTVAIVVVFYGFAASKTRAMNSSQPASWQAHYKPMSSHIYFVFHNLWLLNPRLVWMRPKSVSTLTLSRVCRKHTLKRVAYSGKWCKWTNISALMCVEQTYMHLSQACVPRIHWARCTLQGVGELMWHRHSDLVLSLVLTSTSVPGAKLGIVHILPAGQRVCV